MHLKNLGNDYNLLEQGFQVFPSVRLRALRDLFRCADRDDLAAADTAFGTEIDYPVCGFDDIEIVLDDDEASTIVDKCAKRGEKFVDVVEM